MSSSSASTRVKSLDELYARECLDILQVTHLTLWTKEGEVSIDVTRHSPEKMRALGYVRETRKYVTKNAVRLSGSVAEVCDLAIPQIFDYTAILENLANSTIAIVSRNYNSFPRKHYNYYKKCRDDIKPRWKQCRLDALRNNVTLDSNLDYYYIRYDHSYGDYSPDAPIPLGETADYNLWRKLMYLTIKKVVSKEWDRVRAAGEDFCIGVKEAVFADLNDAVRPRSSVANIGHTADIVTEWLQDASAGGDHWTVVRTDLHVSTNKSALTFAECDFNVAGTIDVLAVRRRDLKKFKRGQKCGVRLIVIQTTFRQLKESVTTPEEVLHNEYTPASWWSCYLSICKQILETRSNLRVDSMVIVNANNARKLRSDRLQVVELVDMSERVDELLLPIDGYARKYEPSSVPQEDIDDVMFAGNDDSVDDESDDEDADDEDSSTEEIETGEDYATASTADVLKRTRSSARLGANKRTRQRGPLNPRDDMQKLLANQPASVVQRILRHANLIVLDSALAIEAEQDITDDAESSADDSDDFLPRSRVVRRSIRTRGRYGGKKK